ncbi:MAG: putative RNA uridine N3 methyltransferase [Halobaculum sp.]
MHGTSLTILVPSSLVREAEDGREATRKLGYVARAATLFRADRLVVFPDREGESGRGGEFVRSVLGYATTAPYLRQAVWDRRDELRHVGVLPPLLPDRSGPDGSELRDGIVTEVGPDDRVRVNCGLDPQHPISLRAPGRDVSEGERVTVSVSSREPVRAKLVDEAVGVRVTGADLQATLAEADATIAASRYGTALSVSGLAGLPDALGDPESVAVAFGAPTRGLPAILDGMADEATGVDPAATPFDRWLNTVPEQGSEVVRTEEAMIATLGPLRLPP